MTTWFSGRLNLVEGGENQALLRAEIRNFYNGAESKSLGFTSLADWKHLHVLIEDVGVLDDETVSPGSAQFLGTRKPLTRRDHPNVELSPLPDDRAASHRIRIDAPLPTLFDTVIRGFLWDLGFHYSPATRDRTRDNLRKQIAGIDAGDPDAARADYERQRALEFGWHGTPCESRRRCDPTGPCSAGKCQPDKELRCYLRFAFGASHPT